MKDPLAAEVERSRRAILQIGLVLVAVVLVAGLGGAVILLRTRSFEDSILDGARSVHQRVLYCANLNAVHKLSPEQRRVCVEELAPAALEAARRDPSYRNCEGARAAAHVSTRIDPFEVRRLCEPGP